MFDISKDNGVGTDYTIRKIGPMSPTHSKGTVHELYRQIQKGGVIPQHGLQLSPAESPRGKIGVESTLPTITRSWGKVCANADDAQDAGAICRSEC
jgi:hypothetical protein